MKKTHWPHYFSLVGILIATVVGFVAFSYNKNFQLAVVGAASVSYFSWGVVHHFIHRNLSLAVVVEYAMIASIGFVAGISVIFRS